MERLIIYRDLGGLKVTPESNYESRIRNERKVKDCSQFDNPHEIVEYYIRWFGVDRSEIMVNVNCYPDIELSHVS